MHSVSNGLGTNRMTSFLQDLTIRLEDSVSSEPLTDAVVLNCGHSYNESTIVDLSMDLSKYLCPECRVPITGYKANYALRGLAESVSLAPAPKEAQTIVPQPIESKNKGQIKEAEEHFKSGRALCEQGKQEEGVNALFRALELDPNNEKAYSYLEFVTDPNYIRKPLASTFEKNKKVQDDLNSNQHNSSAANPSLGVPIIVGQLDPVAPSAPPRDPEENSPFVRDQLLEIGMNLSNSKVVLHFELNKQPTHIGVVKRCEVRNKLNFNFDNSSVVQTSLGAASIDGQLYPLVPPSKPIPSAPPLDPEENSLSVRDQLREIRINDHDARVPINFELNKLQPAEAGAVTLCDVQNDLNSSLDNSAGAQTSLGAASLDRQLDPLVPPSRPIPSAPPLDPEENSPSVRGQPLEMETNLHDKMVAIKFELNKQPPNYAEAVKLYSKVLEIQKSVLGHNHPDVAKSLTAMVNCYHFQGHYEEACKVYSELLEIRKATLGDKHYDVATGLWGMANLWYFQGNYAEALKLYSKALEIQKEILGDKHLDVAKSLYGIANCYHSQGNCVEALKLHSNVLKTRKAALGDEHSDVVSSLYEMANCYHSQGNYEEALKLHSKALDIRKTVLWDKHHLAESLTGMANCYHSRGNYAEALKLHSEALEIRKAVLVDKHPDVATSLNGVAECRCSQGKYAEALKLHFEALEIRKAALGNQHPDVATSLTGMANCYYSQGNKVEALKLHSKALEIRKAALGDKHPDVATSLNNMANCYYSQGNYADTLKLYSEALVIKKAALGDKHPDVATSSNNMANCYYSQGNYADALKLHSKALEIWKAALGNKHPYVATSLNGIAECYYSLKNYAKALKLHSEALEIRRAALGDKHRDVAASLSNIEKCRKSLQASNQPEEDREYCPIQ
jgi:tetratricopeptide (TPR) repeat protein